MRTYSSLQGRSVETVSGEKLGRCRDLQGTLTPSGLQVTGLCVGRRAWLEHLGVFKAKKQAVVPWDAVVRIEGQRVIVRDGAATERTGTRS
jgi:sporulation protein YlmC with PRC-barrel domain